MKSSARGLTNTELEIVKLIAVGKSPKEISEDTHRSAATVSSHLTSIFNKLEISSRVELVHYALWLDLVPNMYSIGGSRKIA